MTLKELRERQQKIVHEARQNLDSINDDTPKARADELEAAFDKAMEEYDRIDKRAERMEKAEKAESALEEEVTDVPEVEPREVPAKAEKPEIPEERHREVFQRYMRYGMGNLSHEERSMLRETRAQSVGTDSAGGYTVPTGFVSDVVETMKAFGPMLDPGITDQITTTGGGTLEFPTLDDTSNKGALLAENTADSEQDLTFGQKVLDAFKYTTKIIRVSEELLQDNEVNVEGRISGAFGTRIGRIVNEHLTTGTGTSQPNGIVTASTKGADAGAAAAIDFDDMIELYHSVDPSYRALGGRWMFNDTTLKLLRKLKDSNSNYIWQPADVATGQPATILDAPYSINQDMADVTNSAKSVLFGLFSRYVVRRVRELVLKRLVERYAEFHQVGFIGFARYDGELLDTAAVKHLLHPAS